MANMLAKTYLINKIALPFLIFCASFLRAENPLSLNQKIGQLFVIPACPMRAEDHREDLHRLIADYHIGGILLKQGTAQEQLNLIAELQKASQIPLLCVQDGEWGVAMRITDALSLPKNLTLGAIENETLLFRLGEEIGRQCRLVGIDLNLAPVVDTNSNMHNPIIHMRSLGEDFHNVAKKGSLIMQGIQSMGVIACAKHFPGHGDTAVDSHQTLPTLFHKKDQLYANELHPFRSLIDAQVGAVMSAHLYLPAIAESLFLPATFSRQIITEILRNELGFKGLIITDALNMKALSSRYGPEEIAVNALFAGHNLLLYGDHIAPNIDQILKRDLPRAFEAIKLAVQAGQISEEMLDKCVDKILQIKKKLSHRPAVQGKINSQEALALKRDLFREAITVVRNEGILPVKLNQVTLVQWGQAPAFNAALGQSDPLCLEDPDLMSKLIGAEQIILSLANIKPDLPNYGMEEVLESLRSLSLANIPITAVLFGTPYALCKTPLFEGLIVAYENEREAQEAAAEIIKGAISPRGRLPVSAPPNFPRGVGLSWGEGLF